MIRADPQPDPGNGPGRPRRPCLPQATTAVTRPGASPGPHATGHPVRAGRPQPDRGQRAVNPGKEGSFPVTHRWPAVQLRPCESPDRTASRADSASPLSLPVHEYSEGQRGAGPVFAGINGSMALPLTGFALCSKRTCPARGHRRPRRPVGCRQRDRQSDPSLAPTGTRPLLASWALPSRNSVAVAVATLVIAALFDPLRKQVQHAVDRRFNRAR